MLTFDWDCVNAHFAETASLQCNTDTSQECSDNGYRFRSDFALELHPACVEEGFRQPLMIQNFSMGRKPHFIENDGAGLPTPNLGGYVDERSHQRVLPILKQDGKRRSRRIRATVHRHRLRYR